MLVLSSSHGCDCLKDSGIVRCWSELIFVKGEKVHSPLRGCTVVLLVALLVLMPSVRSASAGQEQDEQRLTPKQIGILSAVLGALYLITWGRPVRDSSGGQTQRRAITNPLSNIRWSEIDPAVVQIMYDLDSAQFSRFDIELRVIADGQSLQVRALSGDVGQGVEIGSNKTIVWKSAEDLEDGFLGTLQFDVIADLSH